MARADSIDGAPPRPASASYPGREIDEMAGQEHELVMAAQGGSKRAFESLHLRHGRLVHGILLAKVPREAADDLVQEVFTQAWVGLRMLRDPGAFGSWIAQMARRRAADFHRTRARTASVPVDARHAGRMSDPEQALLVIDLIKSLPEAYIEPLMLRLVEGMSGPEIAEATGLTHGSVRINLSRGYALLRSRIAEDRR